jgi:hypothetical protein
MVAPQAEIWDEELGIAGRRKRARQFPAFGEKKIMSVF